MCAPLGREVDVLEHQPAALLALGHHLPLGLGEGLRRAHRQRDQPARRRDALGQVVDPETRVVPGLVAHDCRRHGVRQRTNGGGNHAIGTAGPPQTAETGPQRQLLRGLTDRGLGAALLVLDDVLELLADRRQVDEGRVVDLVDPHPRLPRGGHRVRHHGGSRTAREGGGGCQKMRSDHTQMRWWCAVVCLSHRGQQPVRPERLDDHHAAEGDGVLGRRVLALEDRKGNDTVLATQAVGTRGNGTVLAAKAMEARGGVFTSQPASGPSSFSMSSGSPALSSAPHSSALPEMWASNSPKHGSVAISFSPDSCSSLSRPDGMLRSCRSRNTRALGGGPASRGVSQVIWLGVSVTCFLDRAPLRNMPISSAAISSPRLCSLTWPSRKAKTSLSCCSSPRTTLR